MSRRSLILLCVVVAAGLLAGAARAAGPVRLTEAPGATFPDRRFVLTLPPGTTLGADDLVVTEDGQPVHDLAVTPVSAGGDAGTVLVIDASNSMRGEPILNAVSAARAFAARRAPNQQLAVVTFNRRTQVVVPFTRDDADIGQALATAPTLGEGTHLHDGVARALGLIRDADVEVGSVVVLSDGADTGSALSLEAVADEASDGRVRIFSVALASPQFDPVALRRLADASGGSYSEATTAADLAPIFAKLGTLLANEYFVEYRSFAAAEARVAVAATIRGTSAVVTAEYVAPALSLPSGAPMAFRRSMLDRVLQSDFTMVAIVGLFALVVAIVVAGAIRPRFDIGVQGRMAPFVSLHEPEHARRQTSRLTEMVLESTDKSLRRTEWWPRFKEGLDVAGVRMPAEQIVVVAAVGGVLAVWFANAVAGFPAALLGFAVPAGIYFGVRRRVDRALRAFEDQLPDNLEVLASALRAGHSYVGAMTVMADDAAEPSQRELRRVLQHEQLGVPLEDALAIARRRLRNRDLEQVSLVAALQRETGSDSAEVLDRVTENVRARAELRRLVNTLTAQGRLARWVLTALPVGLLLVLTMINPTYMSPLYTTTLGAILLTIGGVMVVMGSLVIKKIVNIKI